MKETKAQLKETFKPKDADGKIDRSAIIKIRLAMDGAEKEWETDLGSTCAIKRLKDAVTLIFPEP